MVVLGASNTADGILEIGDYVFRDSLPERAVIPNTDRTRGGAEVPAGRGDVRR